MRFARRRSKRTRRLGEYCEEATAPGATRPDNPITGNTTGRADGPRCYLHDAWRLYSPIQVCVCASAGSRLSKSRNGTTVVGHLVAWGDRVTFRALLNSISCARV